MKTIIRTLTVASMSLLALASLARADVLTVSPNKAIVLPADESGATKVLFLFDLSGLREGDGRRIDSALLEWQVEGVPSDAHSEYRAYSVLAPWTEVAAQTEPDAVSIGQSEVDEWDFEPLDYERNDGGFIRLNVQSLVVGWLAENASNYGVVLATSDVSRADLAQQRQEVTLTVRYGFVSPE